MERKRSFSSDPTSSRRTLRPSGRRTWTPRTHSLLQSISSPIELHKNTRECLDTSHLWGLKMLLLKLLILMYKSLQALIGVNLEQWIQWKIRASVDLAGLSLQLPEWKVVIKLRGELFILSQNNSWLTVAIMATVLAVTVAMKMQLSTMQETSPWWRTCTILTTQPRISFVGTIHISLLQSSQSITLWWLQIALKPLRQLWLKAPLLSPLKLTKTYFNSIQEESSTQIPVEPP